MKSAWASYGTLCDPLVRLPPPGLMLLYQTLRIVIAPVFVTLGLPIAFASHAEAYAQGDVGSPIGSVAGVVWDSISGEPLENAAVFLWGTPYRGVSDVAGRYRIEGVPEGDYSVLFFHTRLGAWGISPGAVPISVNRAPVEVDLATPSRATVFQSQCLFEARPRDAVIVAGRVYDGDAGVPLGNARVTLSWQTDELARSASTYVRTESDGWFRACDVPSDRPILVGVDYIGRQSLRRELDTADPYVEADFPLYPLSPSRISATLVDAGSGEAIEGAVAWIRGTAFTALSDRGGHFEFESVPAGTYMLMTEHIAYGTKMDTLVVPAGQRLLVSMMLDTRPIPIAPLTVSTEAPPVEMARRRGGIVITRDQIDTVRQRSRDASDIIRALHLPGIIVRHQSNGVICVGYITGQVKMNQTGCVEMMIYINDVRATDPDIALRLPPESIERMVIYKPIEAGNLFGLGGGNGVWAIYTRGN